MESSFDARAEFVRRSYQVRDGQGVVLVVYQPEPFPDGQDFKCDYQIQGIGDERMRFAGGVDALQCILLALEMAASLLVSSVEYQSGQLYWLDPNDPDLGLPLAHGESWRR